MRKKRRDSNTPMKFWSQVEIKLFDECWLWTGVTSDAGYGLARIYDNKNITTAHRVAWRLSFGEIENKELDVAHKCANRLCVNPAHLYLSSRSENSREIAYRKGYLYPDMPMETVQKAQKLALEKHKLAKIVKDFGIDTDKIRHDYLVMMCGHSNRYIVSSNEGTHFCLMCEFLEVNKQLTNLKNAVISTGLFD